MYRKKAHIHFVGIGGIGMSGIATILRYQGYTITGCDLDLEQKSVHDLQAIGCTVFHGNNTPECHKTACDILVYSSAIRPDNPEILAAQQRGIPTIGRALMLAELMRTKHGIAIAGAHGKTTTTSMISHILIEAGIDPTVIIGGHLKNISTNARLGHGDFLVAEADESDRSFLHLHATLALVTNIDLEHLETYANLDDVKQTFIQFLNNLPFYGKAILCIDDENIRSILPQLKHIKTIKYGLTPHADIWATDIKLNPDHSILTVLQTGMSAPLGTMYLNMPGRHNVLNALGAIAVALDLGIPFATAAQALQNFKGIDRRFSYKGSYKGTEIFDDYGHHPVEIMNTLCVAANRAQGPITVLFQPHRYTRTKFLWQEFIDMFLKSRINHLIITDIYAASEDPLEGINSKRFVEAIKAHNPSFTVTYAPIDDQFSAILPVVEPLIQEKGLLLLLGAGKANKLAQFLV